MVQVNSLRFLLGLMMSIVAIAGAENGPAPVEHVYASPDGVDLKAYVYAPSEKDSRESKPAVVIFHGGGWTIGSAEWGFSLAEHFANLGLVGISAQYRLSDQRSVTPLEAIEDAQAVIRWIRSNADTLGIDPNRIAAYGWSAGAHLATCAAIFGDSKPGEVSGAPNVLLLKSPAVAVGTSEWVQELLGDRAKAKEISPDLLVRKGLPSTFIVQGRTDTVTPTPGVERFCDRMQEVGNSCELHIYEGVGHLFTPSTEPDYDWPNPDPKVRAEAAREVDRFLVRLEYVKNSAIVSAHD
ncbi:MAG: alpha/beta hydrolase [bacterium]|nr:alpha/beta hydrolase [bacterium]